MKAYTALRQAQQAAARSLVVFVRDVAHGLLEISHNTLALLGLAVVAALVFTAGRADVRTQIETAALGWLQSRHESRQEQAGDILSAVADQDGVSRATAIDPKELGKEQALVARWITKRYKVAPEPISRLVQEAWNIGKRANLDPTLILAVMAVESSFNPFAQSTVGAQGLMQVMTRVHDDKYEVFGGTHAAFDPVSNLRVGVQVLKECIARAGNLNDGLRHYVGAALLASDGGYVGRVLAEQAHLRNVADGRAVPANVQTASAAAAPVAATPAKVTPPAAKEAEAATAADQLALLR